MFDKQNHFLEQALFVATGQSLEIKQLQMVSGGCINQTVHLTTSGGDFFIKWNQTADDEMFGAEAKGLSLLKEAGALPVPGLVGQGQVDGQAFLLLEYLESAPLRKDYWTELGQGLAVLHGHSSETWGLDHNNFIGRLPQSNEPATSWVDFFIERRLEPQISLAYYNQQVDKAFLSRFRKLYPQLKELLPESRPALLHGDLWNGNVMPGPDGKAWIFDPAVYYGHPEIELAFTKLFGGFDGAFYRAYQEVHPLEPGFEQRFDLYNLYPLLVHVNLFGAAYLSGVERTLKHYL